MKGWLIIYHQSVLTTWGVVNGVAVLYRVLVVSLGKRVWNDCAVLTKGEECWCNNYTFFFFPHIISAFFTCLMQWLPGPGLQI